MITYRASRPDRAHLVLPTVLLIIITSACGLPRGGQGSPFAAGEETVFANSAGGLSATLAGGTYRLEAGPGVFPSGRRLAVKPSTAAPDLGGGRFLLTPIEVMTESQPTRPVTLQTKNSYSVSADLTVGVAWDRAGNRLELLPIQKLDTGQFEVSVPHFSALGLVTFPSAVDLNNWIAGPVADGVINYLKDFFSVPYDCPPPKFQSVLLESLDYPNSVNLQLDVNDNPDIGNTAHLSMCNRLRFVMAYEASGAGGATGFALPRSTLPLDIPLKGAAGDRFVVQAAFTPEAVTATVAMLAITVVPGGSQLIRGLLAKGAPITLFTNSARSCASSIDAALRTANASTWDGVISCLKNLESFQQAVVDLWVRAAIEGGLHEAVKLVPPIKAILISHAINRVALEWVLFGLPKEVSFSYRLRCTIGTSVECAPPGSLGRIPSVVKPPANPPINQSPNQPVDPPSNLPVDPPDNPPVNPPTNPPAAKPPALKNIVIKRVWTRDSSGNDQTAFTCGDQVRLSLSVENPNAEAVTTELDFLAETDGRRLYYYEQTIDIPPGLAYYESPFTLPVDADGSAEYVADVFPGPKELSPSDSSSRFTINCSR